MTKLNWLTALILGSTLAFTGACGDDDGGTDDGGNTADASTDTPDGSTDTPDAGDEADASTAVTAAEFCAGYETTCGYDDTVDDRHNDEATCLAAYDGYGTGRQDCVNEHLALAEDDAATHCPHATGMGPCAGGGGGGGGGN